MKYRSLAAALAASAMLPLSAAHATDLEVTHWWTSGGEAAAVECATLEVPLDYDRPRGDTLDVHVARVRAADPATRIGTLVFNFGGPGAAAADRLEASGRNLFPALGTRYDLVGLAMQDQRRYIDGWQHRAEVGLGADVARRSNRCWADVLPHHRGQRLVAVARYEVREQTRVGLRVERIAQVGHAEEHLEPSCHLLWWQRPCPAARIATDQRETGCCRWVALEA